MTRLVSRRGLRSFLKERLKAWDESNLQDENDFDDDSTSQVAFETIQNKYAFTVQVYRRTGFCCNKKLICLNLDVSEITEHVTVVLDCRPFCLCVDIRTDEDEDAPEELVEYCETVIKADNFLNVAFERQMIENETFIKSVHREVLRLQYLKTCSCGTVFIGRSENCVQCMLTCVPDFHLEQIQGSKCVICLDNVDMNYARLHCCGIWVHRHCAETSLRYDVKCPHCRKPNTKRIKMTTT